MQYLVDSDWAIDYLQRRRRALRRLDALLPQGVGLSIISLGEIYDGLLGSPDRDRAEQELERFLEELEGIVPLDPQTCRIFAAERRRLRESGQRIEDPDIYIGATAIRHNLTLLTNNRRHFERMRGLDIISA